MSKTIQEVMSSNPAIVLETDSCVKAAQMMGQQDIGDVLVVKESGELCGIVTDRDIVVRTLAIGQDPAMTPLGSICSPDVKTLAPEASTDDAIHLMRDHAVRRIPVLQNGRPVGIVTLGDLAEELAPNSVLGQVSAAAPNH